MKEKTTLLVEKVQHCLRSASKGKPVKAFFGDEPQTKIGGGCLLWEVERSNGLIAGAARCLREWRLPSCINFSMFQLLWQRVLLICCGYEDAVDGQLLSSDPGLQLGLGFKPAMQSTMSRFENRIGMISCYKLASWLVYHYIATKRREPESIRLDFDGSCFRVRGQQQGSSYRKHYDTQMLFPLFVFDQDGVLITAMLRPGSHGELSMTLPILKRLVKVFRSAWPNVKITVVMDAGFNSPRIYDWCEDQGKEDPVKTVYYLIKLKNTGGGLLSHSDDLARAAKISFTKCYGEQRYKEKASVKKTELEKQIMQKEKSERRKELKELSQRIGRSYGEFRYQTGMGGKDPKQWRSQRRILVECKYDDWGARRTFWITNLIGGRTYEMINDIYARRGEQELRIKDAKAFRCDKMSLQEFLPNQFRLLMHVLSQRLLRQFREVLPERFQRVSLKSISETFLRMPAIIQEKARTVEIRWPASFGFKNAVHTACRRLLPRISMSTASHPNFDQFWKPLFALSRNDTEPLVLPLSRAG